MPKDHWQKARNKDAAQRGEHLPVHGRKQRRAKSKKATKQQHLTKIALQRLQSWSCRLWFGQHKDKLLKDVPKAYLRWLANTNSDSWRIKAIQQFLNNPSAYCDAPASKAKAQTESQSSR